LLFSYSIVITGLEAGIAKDTAIKKLAKLLEVTGEKVASMLESPKWIVKRGVDFQAAVKYVEVLENCGWTCEVRPEANVGHPPLPSLVTTPLAPPAPASPFSSIPSAAAYPPPAPLLATAPKEWDSVVDIEPQGKGLKLTLIVMAILGLLAVGGGGYFVWESKKQSEAVEKARAEQDAKLQVERAAMTQHQAETVAQQESLKLALIEKEDAIRIANAEAADREAETNAANEQAQATLQLERDAKQQALQNASREQVIEDQRAAIQRMLNNARTCLSRLNYSCVITNAENVLSFEPGNKSAQDFKRTAEDAQNKATENIRIN